MPDTVTCKSCERQFSSKMRNCPHCGYEHRREPVHATPICPVCDCDMVNHAYHGDDVDMCPQCNSIWLDGREFKKLISERNVFRDESIPDEYIKPLHKAPGEYHKCPLCSDYMVQRNFKKISGVIIDICRDHGVWLEAGELEGIRCFVANGGLHDVHDKEIMLNREAIESLDTRLSDVEFMQKLLHHWKLKRWMFS